MLRIHFIQHWFDLADEACEEALYDSADLRRFAGIDLGREPMPIRAILKFRRLLPIGAKLGEQLFAKVGEVLSARSLRAQDRRHRGHHHHRRAKLPPRTPAARAIPEMHPDQEGPAVDLGMKLRPSAWTCRTGLAHGAVAAAANVHDERPLPGLLHGNGGAYGATAPYWGPEAA